MWCGVFLCQKTRSLLAAAANMWPCLVGIQAETLQWFIVWNLLCLSHFRLSLSLTSAFFLKKRNSLQPPFSLSDWKRSSPFSAGWKEIMRCLDWEAHYEVKTYQSDVSLKWILCRCFGIYHYLIRGYSAFCDTRDVTIYWLIYFKIREKRK